MAKIHLVIGQSHSLKEKRMVLRRIKDRVRERVGVVVNEVGEHDIWQRAQLGFAVASTDRTKAMELLDDVVRCIAACEGGDIVAIAKDAIPFTPEMKPITITVASDRSGSGDKAVGASDWVPEEWQKWQNEP